MSALGELESLDFRLLVYAEDDGVRGRINIEADDVANLGDELGIAGNPEVTVFCLGPSRRPAKFTRPRAGCRPRPWPLPARLNGRSRLRISGGQRDDLFCNVVGQLRSHGGPGLVAQETSYQGVHDPRMPLPKGSIGDAGLGRDLCNFPFIGHRQDDFGARDLA